MENLFFKDFQPLARCVRRFGRTGRLLHLIADVGITSDSATMIPMPGLTLNSRLVRNPNLVAVDMDGDIVMMSIECGQYFGIGGVGARVWELLEQPLSVDELAQVIHAEYEVDEATCQADLLVFVRSLVTHEVVRLC